MRKNLTDREKLEIEKYAEEVIKKKPIGAFEIISGVFGSLAGLGLLIVGIIFLFATFWVIGLVMIIVGIIFLSSANKSQEKVKQIKQERKEELIKEFQLKALKGQKIKPKNERKKM